MEEFNVIVHLLANSNCAVDGKEVGRVQSKLLCRSVFDLYMGEDPFDRKAKEEIELNLASLAPKH